MPADASSTRPRVQPRLVHRSTRKVLDVNKEQHASGGGDRGGICGRSRANYSCRRNCVRSQVGLLSRSVGRSVGPGQHADDGRQRGRFDNVSMVMKNVGHDVSLGD
jgi:hypothetical protein